MGGRRASAVGIDRGRVDAGGPGDALRTGQVGARANPRRRAPRHPGAGSRGRRRGGRGRTRRRGLRLVLRRETAAGVRSRVARPSRSVAARSARSARSPIVRAGRLLDLDRGAGLFQLLLELLGVVLGDAGLDRLGGGLDEVLGLLQAEAGGGADDLDDVDLVGAEGLQDDVELGLRGDRLGRRRPAAAGPAATAAAAALIPWTSSR